jgi:hypothetical protein
MTQPVFKPETDSLVAALVSHRERKTATRDTLLRRLTGQPSEPEQDEPLGPLSASEEALVRSARATGGMRIAPNRPS